MRLAAVCAIYGAYDLIPPVPEGVDDAVLVTDVPVRSGWRNVVEPSDAHPRLAAKRPRGRPDLYTDCEASLWMDGSTYVMSDRFIALVRAKLERHELVLWKHPEDRDCLVDEALVCHDWPQYREEPLLAQVDHYLSQGMPRNFGLWATGSIARLHSDRMKRFGDSWLDEMARWTVQDQVSLPFLLWRDGVEPGEFGLEQFDNDLITWLPHRHELGTYRISLPRLTARVSDLESEREALVAALESEKAQHARLRARRSVRGVLAVADTLGQIRRRIRTAGRSA
jgi:hypothetical protein